MQQEIFSNLALISVELANSFWPRKLSAAPIGNAFRSVCRTFRSSASSSTRRGSCRGPSHHAWHRKRPWRTPFYPMKGTLIMRVEMESLPSLGLIIQLSQCRALFLTFPAALLTFPSLTVQGFREQDAKAPGPLDPGLAQQSSINILSAHLCPIPALVVLEICNDSLLMSSHCTWLPSMFSEMSERTLSKVCVGTWSSALNNFFISLDVAVGVSGSVRPC